MRFFYILFSKKKEKTNKIKQKNQYLHKNEHSIRRKKR